MCSQGTASRTSLRRLTRSCVMLADGAALWARATTRAGVRCTTLTSSQVRQITVPLADSRNPGIESGWNCKIISGRAFVFWSSGCTSTVCRIYPFPPSSPPLVQLSCNFFVPSRWPPCPQCTTTDLQKSGISFPGRSCH